MSQKREKRTVIEVKNLRAGYGFVEVVHDVSFSVCQINCSWSSVKYHLPLPRKRLLRRILRQTELLPGFRLRCRILLFSWF